MAKKTGKDKGDSLRWIVLGVVFVAALAYCAEDLALLRGVRGKATVTKVVGPPGGEKTPGRRVEVLYEFKAADGKDYKSRQRVRAIDWTVGEGASIEVLYSAMWPKLNAIAGTRTLLKPIGFAVLALACLSLAVSWARAARRQEPSAAERVERTRKVA